MRWSRRIRKGPSPTPHRKKAEKALATQRAALRELEQTYGQQARTNSEAQRPTMRGFKIAQAGLNRQITALEARRSAGKSGSSVRLSPCGTASSEASGSYWAFQAHRQSPHLGFFESASAVRAL